MSVLATIPEPVRARFSWERQLRPAIEALQGFAPRAFVVGGAGAGKSAALRHLHELLAGAGRPARLISAGAAPIERVPSDHVLIVDDVHLLDARQAAQLRRRSEDPQAGLIAAGRPWPMSEDVRVLTQQLEQQVPAIVLGHLARADVLDLLEEHEVGVPVGCVSHILECTHGVSWLVRDALELHDQRDCVDDPDHRELARAMEQRIAHRLDRVTPRLRRLVEEVCVAPPGDAQLLASTDDDGIRQGHAEGLLLNSGMPAPIVRAAVRSTMPVRRFAELTARYSESLAQQLAEAESDDDWTILLHDPTMAAALVREGDRMLRTRPARAVQLYDAAVECGAEPEAVRERRVQAHWGAGDLNALSALIDEAPTPPAAGGAPWMIDMSAAIWAARGFLDKAEAVYRLSPTPRDAGTRGRAAIAGFGVGVTDALESAATSEIPSAVGVAMDLLRQGLAASVHGEATASVLSDLVRASEMYTLSQSGAPLCELPAVIAAVTALNLGAIATAQAVIDDALAGGQGGPQARPRLLLWQAWVAVQRGLPGAARDALRRALDLRPLLSARDALLAHAVRVAIARRYEDAAGLEAAWKQARGSILRTDIDLYLLHPLSELISAATRTGESEHIEPHVSRALELTEKIGSPPLWTAHLRWAGVQQGILLNSPDRLAPHAKALVATAGGSEVAQVMARAGRVWTSVLAGTVDADAVESAAESLASIGLLWDAARLAGHGAARTADRRVAARLLACARDLHPAEGPRRPAGTEDDASTTPPRPTAGDILSEREIEVARLVLQGRTYAEIGEAIFISPRTAEHHIAHIRRRLGATSRSEVLAKLHQLLDGAPEASGDRPRGFADRSP